MNKNQKKRIDSVFSNKVKDVLVSTETIQIYKDYLIANLSLPVKLTGIEEFDWEEFYILGPGDEEEYEEEKKTNPSYSDIFNLIGIEEYIDCDYGVYVMVERESDKKKFQLPLANLEVIDDDSPNSQIVYDYTIWFANY